MAKKELLRNVIIKVLKGESKPLRIKEIYQKIKEDNLYSFNTDNPEHIVRTLLRRQSQNIDFPSSHKKKYFVFLEDGTFWLKNSPLEKSNKFEEKKVEVESNSRQIIKLHKSYLSDFRNDILKQLSSIDPKVFENFCKGLLKAYGFKNVNITSYSKDGGIDGYGNLKMGLTAMPVAFECKRWSKPVSRPKLSQFKGDIQGKYQQGIFFTTSRFTKEAKDQSMYPGSVPIVLIDGPEIINIMIEKEYGVEKELLPIYTNALDLILENK
ncbi:restriction system protein [Salegentibacter sp. 24]|uniref:restriction endonuclease n=1 Tax=Salegentibacter sp. 24 TaxID=2183986 RepID=UPI0010613A89|nr:restriction endonuclease [Salegentibacter sp. 24]TDN87061.1 restriction system protein [Salegentibacter sp. 24]